MLNPVSGVDVEPPGQDFADLGNVAVSEGHDLQVRIFRETIGRPLVKPARPAQRFCIRRPPMPTLSAADQPDDPGREVRMQPTKCAASRASTDHPLQGLVSEVAAAETIAVGQEGRTSPDLGSNRPFDELQADLIGVERASPEIVIAGHESNADARLDQGPEDLEDRKMAPLNDRSVFEPEIEQVAVDHKVTGAVDHAFEKAKEGRLVVGGGGAEVGVRDDQRAIRVHLRQYRGGSRIRRQVWRGVPRAMEDQEIPGSRTEIRVRYAETDQMGHAHHMNYLAWFELGRTELMRMNGLSYAELERSGILLPVARAELSYRKGAGYDERVEILTRVVEVRSRSVTFGYEAIRADDGVRLASGSTTLVCTDAGLRPRRMPDSAMRILADLCADPIS